MPRIRTVKPGFFKSEDVSALPFRARLTWVGLWTQCDDHGRYKDSVRLIKGDVWPLDDVSLRDIEEDLSILEEQRRLVRYEVDEKRYLAVVNWHAHQAINRPGKPKYPAPPVPLGSSNPDDENHCDACAKPGTGALLDSSRMTHGALTEDSRQEGKGKEWKGGDARTGANGDPPPPRCPQHLHNAKPPPCGPCAGARRARADWDTERARRGRDAPKCRQHRGQLADNCALCRSEALADEGTETA